MQVYSEFVLIFLSVRSSPLPPCMGGVASIPGPWNDMDTRSNWKLAVDSNSLKRVWREFESEHLHAYAKTDTAGAVAAAGGAAKLLRILLPWLLEITTTTITTTTTTNTTTTSATIIFTT